jgi:hypothetical protein
MSAPMQFRGKLLYTSEALARDAVDALAGFGPSCAIRARDATVRGGDVRFHLENVWPSEFYETTLVALSEMCHRAFCAVTAAIYNYGRDFGEQQLRFPGPGQPYPGIDKPPVLTIHLAATYALVGDAVDLARAKDMVRVKDVPTFARIVEGLPFLIYQVRLARVLEGRREPAAKRVLATLAAREIDAADPWADEIRAIRASTGSTTSPT